METLNGKPLDYSVTIPTFVTSLHEKCFYDFYRVKELTLPQSLKHIPTNYLEKCNRFCYIGQ